MIIPNFPPILKIISERNELPVTLAILLSSHHAHADGEEMIRTSTSRGK